MKNKIKSIAVIILSILVLIQVSLLYNEIFTASTETTAKEKELDKDSSTLDGEGSGKYTTKDGKTPVRYEKAYLDKEKELALRSRNIRIDWTLQEPSSVKLGSVGDIKFNRRYDKTFVEVNTTLYQIVSRYMSDKTFKDLSTNKFVDPLMILALSNVEFGGNTDYNILLAPAIPTNKGIIIGKETLTNFGYSDYLKFSNILSSDRDGYRGMLQMYCGGFDEGIIPSDLIGNEYTRLLNAPNSVGKDQEMKSLQCVEGSGVSSSLDGMYLANSPKKTGDRYNYADSVNRLCGEIHKNWLRYQQSEFQKQSNYSIDTKEAWISLTSIGHNSSPGMYYMGDNKTLDSKYYWWPFNSFGDAREYCHYLGTKEACAEIESMARINLSTFRESSGALKFRLSRQEGVAIANRLVSENIIPNNIFTINNTGQEEKVSYPIQVLYNYYLLRLIYTGM